MNPATLQIRSGRWGSSSRALHPRRGRMWFWCRGPTLYLPGSEHAQYEHDWGRRRYSRYNRIASVLYK